MYININVYICIYYIYLLFLRVPIILQVAVLHLLLMLFPSITYYSFLRAVILSCECFGQIFFFFLTRPYCKSTLKELRVMYLPRCSRMPCHLEGRKWSSFGAIRMPSQISCLALEVSTACDKVLRQRGPSLAHFPVSSLDSCHFQWLVTLAACVVTSPRLLFFYHGLFS